jgi:hypothetical protein
MACTRVSITGKSESILFDTIYNNLANQNEQLADEMFSHFKSELFKKDFGNFIEDYNNNIISDRTDENGEPKLFYNETAKKYYYLNKDNETIYFPLVNRGLRSIWNYDQINKIKSRLALAYFSKSKLDFNNINFDKASPLPKLKDFILKEIQDKINSLEEEGEYFSAMSLEESLNNLDELVSNVESFFKEMNLEIKEDEENGEWIVEEEGKDPVFNQHSAERNTKKSVSTNVKLRLSLLKDNENLDPIWNEPTFLNRDMVYAALQGVLCEEIPLPGEDIFELHKSALNRILAKKPFLKELHSYLNSPDITENQKSEFSQAFNLIKNNHIVSQYITDKNNVVTHKNLQISDTGSKTTKVKEQWDENFQNIFLSKTNKLKDDSVKRIINAGKVIKSNIDNIQEFNKSIKTGVESELQPKFTKLVEDINLFLKALGIETTQEGLQIYLDNYGKDISLQDMTNNLLTLAIQTEYVVKGLSSKYEKETKDYSSFLTLSQTFNKLAAAEAFMLTEGSDATILTGGKQKWIYSYPSYLSSTINQWKRNPQILLDLYKSGQYQLGSYYMGVLTASTDVNGNKLGYNSNAEQIEASRKLLDKIDLGIMNQMSTETDFKKTTDLSYKDYLTDYINKVIIGEFSRTTTPADKTTDLQIKFNLPVSSYNGIVDGQLQLKKQTKDIFFNYFASEYHRMLEASNEVDNANNGVSNDKLTPHYHYQYQVKNSKGESIVNPNPYDKSGNAFKSQYFENLSPNSKNQTELEKQLTDRLYTGSKFNYSLLERGLDPELDQLFDSYLQENFHKRFTETLNYLQSSDIFIRNAKGFIVPNKIDKNTLDTQYKNISELQKAYAITSDFMVNGLINNIEFSKMFSGDVAYYKNMVDYKKRVPATYTDGLQLRINKDNETFKIATIESVNRKSPFYDLLVESLGKNEAKPYESINSADAQAWITPARWKFLIKALGKWTTGADSHESVYHKMMDTSGKNLIYTQKELKLAAQPLKGVYFYRDASGKPVYLKYSQAVLSQALVKNSDLEKLFNKMNADKIDEVITFDGVKVGSIEPTKIHDDNGNIKDEFELNSQTLFNRGWKLQQDLPTKTFKDLDVGSQIQKNIFAGLLHNKTLEGFELDGNLYNGQQIITEIVKAVTGLTNEGLNSLKKEFKIDDNFKIGNISGFYKSLIAELVKRGGSENVVTALNAETTIVGIPQSAGKLFNIFASVMNSRLIKIKTNGGSFIQMSNFGLNKIEAESQGVRWSPLADNTTNEPYIYVNPDTNRPTVKPGGILLSGSFLSKHVPNWRKYSNEELFVSYDGGEPIINKKIQETIIGYRIPNQGLASNDALRIVGILPEASGDTVVAYTGITTKTGSDFDVDKMYVMFPSYSKNSETDRLEYNNYDENNITKKGLQNRLIELYKSVLTHLEVYKSVMKPIDIDFIQNELNALFPGTSTIFMNHFDPEVDLKLRYSFLGGKAGVGQEANAMVDISREGNLSLLGVKNILWGHHNELNESKFDEEFSEELSEEELDYYAAQMLKPNSSTERINEFKDELRKVKIGDSLTAILNAFVDIAKDPYISKGNWIMSTTNVGNMLLRLGAHPLYVVNFLANPIIKQYVDFQKSKEGLTDVQDSGDTIEKFKKEIVINALDKVEGYTISLGNIYKDYFSQLNIDYKKERLAYQLDNKIITLQEYNSSIESIDKSFKNVSEVLLKKLKIPVEELTRVIDNMKQQHDIAFNPNKLNIFDRKTNQWDKYKLNLEYFRNQNTTKTPDINFQINLLNAFKELQEYSKNVRENVVVSKLDTDGMGKSHNDLFALFNQKEQIMTKVNNEVIGAIKGFNTKFEGTTLEAYYNSLKWVKNVVENNALLFPTGTSQIQSIFNEVSNDLYGTNLVNSELVTKLSKDYNTYLLNKVFDISIEENDDILTNLPKRLHDFNEENKGKYFLLDELNIKISKSKKYQSSIELNNRKKSTTYETLFTNSWKDLMIDNPSLAEDLIKYSFITSGFQMNTTQFFTYIPAEYFIQKDINNRVNEINNQNQYDFLDKFYLNNLTDKKLVRKVFKDNIVADGVNINNGFVNLYDKKGNYYVELHTAPSVDADPTVKIKPRYYKLIGYDTEQKGVYARIQELDKKLNNKILYNFNDYTELINDDIIKLQKLVSFDRNMQSIDNEIETNNIKVEQVSEVKEVVKSEVIEYDLYKKYGIKGIEIVNRYSIEDTKNNLDKIYVFGDNTKRVGTAGQASIRNSVNAVGIATKLIPSNNESSFMSDNDFESNKQFIDSDINKLIEKSDEKIIVFPKDGLGTGLAKLKEKAPQTYQYLKDQLLENFGFDNDTGEITNLIKTESIKKEIVNKSEILKPLFIKDTTANVVKGSVVNYNGKKWIVWNITDKDKAQLIDTEGNKFSGTPNLDKLSPIGNYITTEFNGTDYIVTQNENIYSLDTGKQVFTNLDGSTKSKKEKIINQIIEENNLMPEDNTSEEEFDLDSLDYGEITESELNTLTEEEKATIAWQKLNCK